MRGGERCLEVFCELFPDADLYTLLHVRGSVSPAIEGRRIITSFIQRLPDAARRYRSYLPLFPAAIRRFDLRGYDLILSSSHAVAKGVRVPAGRAARLLLLHADALRLGPLRRLLRRARGRPHAAGHAARRGRPPALGPAHRRRACTTSWPISRFIADRIRRCYGRDADVIYPPVDVARFRIEEKPDDFYLVVSALAPYKRVDLAVAAATPARPPPRRGGHGAGGGAAAGAGRAPPSSSSAGGTMPRWPSSTRAAARCSFPRVEDFGITPLEAMAAGPSRHRAGAGGRARDGGPAGRAGAAHRALLRAPDRGRPRRRHAPLRVRRQCASSPRPCAATPRRFDRPIFKERIEGYLDARRSRGHARAEGLLARPRARDAGRRSPHRGGLLARSPTSSRFYVVGPARVRSDDPAARAVPPHDPAHPGRVGHLLPGLRPLPAAAHRLAPVRDGRRRQGLLAGRPRPGRGHDLPLPRVRVLARGHRLLLGSSPSRRSRSRATCSARRCASRAGAATTMRYAVVVGAGELAQQRDRAAARAARHRHPGGGRGRRRQGRRGRRAVARRATRTSPRCWPPARWTT